MTIISKTFHQNGVGTKDFQMRYRMSHLYLWKFSKTDPNPLPHPPHPQRAIFLRFTEIEITVSNSLWTK